MPSQTDLIAAAIANARGGRRGMPPIKNILAVLPQKLVDEVRDEAAAALSALRQSADMVQTYETLSDIEGVLDKQVYPDQIRDNFDAPDDCEYAVTITAGQWRAFGRAITVLERLCKEPER